MRDRHNLERRLQVHRRRYIVLWWLLLVLIIDFFICIGTGFILYYGNRDED